MFSFSAGVSMASARRFVCAGFAAAIIVGATQPAEAGRQVHGGDVARLLMGRAVKIECVDGTQGRGQISQAGVINVLYRRPQSQRFLIPSWTFLGMASVLPPWCRLDALGV